MIVAPGNLCVVSNKIGGESGLVLGEEVDSGLDVLPDTRHQQLLNLVVHLQIIDEIVKKNKL